MQRAEICNAEEASFFIGEMHTDCNGGLFCALQGAAAVAGAGVTQSVCLPLLSVYQLSSNGAIQVGASEWECARRACGNVPGELALLCLAGCGWRGALGVWEDSSSPRTWRLPK